MQNRDLNHLGNSVDNAEHTIRMRNLTQPDQAQPLPNKEFRLSLMAIRLHGKPLLDISTAVLIRRSRDGRILPVLSDNSHYWDASIPHVNRRQYIVFPISNFTVPRVEIDE